MASNRKWFKRALRTLTAGNRELWGLIKEKLTPDQVKHFEQEFHLPTKGAEVDRTDSTSVEESTKPEKTTAVPRAETQRKRKGTTTSSRTVPKRKAKQSNKSASKQTKTPREK